MATPPGAVQFPVPDGLPPNCVTITMGALMLHKVMLASVPAFGGVLSVTVTVAVAFGQGAVPFTV